MTVNYKVGKYDDFPKPLRKHKYIFVYGMLALSIGSFLLFYVVVNTQSILLAFKKFVRENPTDPGYYIWSFDNFTNIWKELTENAESSTQLLEAFKNTMLLFFCGNGVTIPCAFLVSYYLWKQLKGYKVFRIVFYLPHIISSVVMTIIFTNVISPNGLISWISISTGGEALPPFLAQRETAIWFIFIYNTWVGFAGSYILLTSALNRIPNEIIESAQLDGVKPFREFFSICVPLIWPTLSIILLQKVGALLSADGPILLLTNGAYGTYTLGFWSYMQVIVGHSYEFPAAVGIAMTVIVAPLALLTKYLTGRAFRDVEY